jgi:hypothetical protein
VRVLVAGCSARRNDSATTRGVAATRVGTGHSHAGSKAMTGISMLMRGMSVHPRFIAAMALCDSAHSGDIVRRK